MDSYNKYLQRFNYLRKFAGKLISTIFPKVNKKFKKILLLNPSQGLRQTDKQEILILQQYKYLTFLVTDLSRSSGCLLPWPEWPGPEVAARAPDVVVALGAGLGGPKPGEDLFWPWLVLLWWLEDWLPPECPTPPWSLGLVPLDLARHICCCLPTRWS